MNGLKADKYRYCLFYMLDNLEEGAIFLPEALHLTIAPWFVVPNHTELTLKDSFITAFSDFKTTKVSVGSDISLGPRNDISVYLVEPPENIVTLHELALSWLEQIESRWAVKNPYVGADYKPHIRRRENVLLKTGDDISVDSICLIKASRRPDNVRILEAKVNFHA